MVPSHTVGQTPLLPFPEQLHIVLNNLEAKGQVGIASWQPHGRCFTVHNRDEFTKKMLPEWFRMTKFTSFLRQLNIYGFTRIFSGPDKGSYYHDGFLRGQPVAVELIKRMPVKGKGPRRASSKSITPNFYAMVALPVNHPVYSETCTTPRAMSASHATAGRWSFSRHTVEMQTTCNEALPAHLVASPQSAIVTRAASTTHSASGNGGRSYNEPEYSSMDLLAYYFGFRFLVQHWLQARVMGEDEVTPETAAEVLCQQETKLTSCEVTHKHNVMSAQDHEPK